MRAKLTDLVDIQIGFQIREGLEIRPDGTHLLIQAKDIDPDDGYQLKIGTLSHFSPTRNVASYVVRNEDLLFLAKGRRSYAAVVNGLEPNMPAAVALYYFFILRIKSHLVKPAFLAWVINETEASDYLNRAARGTAMPFIPKHAVMGLEIGVPSLATQEKIAEAYKLAWQERRLARSLEKKRFELARTVCRDAYMREVSSR